MITGLILFAVMSLIGVSSYQRPRLEQRVIKNVPVHDWLYILVVPMFSVIAIMLMVINTAARPHQPILDFDDFTILAIGNLFLMFAFVGNGIHFVGKVLSRYIPPKKRSMVYQVNEIFHGKLGHYTIFVCSLLVFFMMALFEINHPLQITMTDQSMNMVIFIGIIMGISAAKIIFNTNQWFGGYNKPLFFMFTILFMALLAIYRRFNINFSYYPLNLVVSTMFLSAMGTFIARQFLIFSRLNHTRKLRFLAKMLSAHK